MIPGETVYIGDGAYLHFDGYSLEFRANDHEKPTDVVCVEGNLIPKLIALLESIVKKNNTSPE